MGKSSHSSITPESWWRWWWLFFVILAPPLLPAPSPFSWKSPEHLHSEIYYLRGPKKFSLRSLQQGEEQRAPSLCIHLLCARHFMCLTL